MSALLNKKSLTCRSQKISSTAMILVICITLLSTKMEIVLQMIMMNVHMIYNVQDLWVITPQMVPKLPIYV